MQFFILVLLVCFIVFLFTLYSLSHDDFVFLRKNISTETIFDVAFWVGFFALLSARFLHVYLYPKPVFYSVLGFSLFPYFPGLSLVGAVLGGIAGLYLFSKKEKIPVNRIFDFFTIALLSAIPVGFIGYIFLSGLTIPAVSSLVIYVIVLFFTLKYIMPHSINGEFKEGFIFYSFLLIFSIVTLLTSFLYKKSFNVLGREEVFFTFLFGFSLILFLQQEIFSKKKFRK